MILSPADSGFRKRENAFLNPESPELNSESAGQTKLGLQPFQN